MIERLHEMFLRLGYKWKIRGILSTPTQRDLEQALDRAKELLYAEPIPSQLEVGRLLVRRTGQDQFETYLYLGDLP